MRHNPILKAAPTVNYSSEIARAVEWLGDRYLLARPINAGGSRAGGSEELPLITHPSTTPIVTRED